MATQEESTFIDSRDNSGRTSSQPPRADLTGIEWTVPTVGLVEFLPLPLPPSGMDILSCEFLDLYIVLVFNSILL